MSLLLRAVRFEDAPHLRKASTNTTTSNKNTEAILRRRNTKNQQEKDAKHRQSLKDSLIDELNHYNNQYSDDYIDSLIVQPPPLSGDLSEELIDKLIIPKPGNLFDELDDNELEKSLSQHTILTQLNSNNLADDLMNKMNKTIQQVKEELSQHEDLIDELRELKSADTIEDLGRSSVLKLIDEDLNEELDLEDQLNKSNDLKRISKTTSCLEMSLLSAKDDEWLSSLRSGKKYSLTEAEKVGKLNLIIIYKN